VTMKCDNQVVHLPSEQTARIAIPALISRLQEPFTAPLILALEGQSPPAEYLSALFGSSSSTAALLTEGSGPGAIVQGGKLVDVDLASEGRDGSSASIIALKLHPEDRVEGLSALRDLGEWLEEHPEHPFALALIAFALVREGLAVVAVDAYPWDPGYDASALTLRWQRAARGRDGLISTAMLRPISLRVSKLAVRGRLSPNFLTLTSVALALAAAFMLAMGHSLWTAGAVVLIYVSLVLDCSDGEVARFTATTSAVGGWLDGFTDRIKEHGLLIGLAIGAAHQGGHVWPLAICAVGVITARHIASFAFIDTVLGSTVPSFAPRGMDAPALNSDSSTGWKDRPGLSQTSARGWVSRVLHAPVSERWALLGICAIVFDAEKALAAYAIYVAISLLLTTAGWIMRTRALPPLLQQQARDDLVVIRDGYGKEAAGTKWVWLSAPVTVIVEIASALLVVFAARHLDATIAQLGFFFAVAMSWLRYERAYGIQHGHRGRITRLGGGWLTRSVLSLGLVLLLQLEITVPVRAILAAATGWLLVLIILAAVFTYTSLNRVREAK